MSNNLNIPVVSGLASGKEAAIDQAHGIIDGFLTEQFTADVDSANYVLTSAEYRQNSQIKILNANDAGRTVTVPAIKRAIFIFSDPANTESVDVKRGTGTVTIAPGEVHRIHTDGTTNGLIGFQFNISGSLSLGDLADVDLSTPPGTKDILVWSGSAFVPDNYPVPAGGTTGQVLKKINGTDYNYHWDDDNTGSGVPSDAGSSDGDVLTTDGAGGFTWETPTGGGGGGGSYLSGGSIPEEADFGTIVNLGGGSVTDTARGLLLALEHANSDNVRAIFQAAPATEPWTITAGFEVLGQQAGFCGVGILQYDGSNKITEWSWRGPIGGGTGAGMTRCRWTNPTTFSADTPIGPIFFGRHFLLRLYNDATNVHYSYSADGTVWNELLSVAKGNFLTTVTHVGVGGLMNSQSGNDRTDNWRVWHWEAIEDDPTGADDVTIGL